MITTILAMSWPSLSAEPGPVLLTIVLLAIGILGSRFTPIDRSLMRGAALARAKRVAPVFLAVFLAVLLTSAFATAWDALDILITGVAGLLAAGLGAFVTVVLLEEHTREELARMPQPTDLDLRTFRIDQLEVTSPPYPHSSLAQGGLRLYKDVHNRFVLAIPRGSVASSVIKHNGQTLAKLVIPNRDNNDAVHGHRVALLGLDTTRQPFLLELPPEYADRSIEECERWLLHAGEDDEIIAS